MSLCSRATGWVKNSRNTCSSSREPLSLLLVRRHSSETCPGGESRPERSGPIAEQGPELDPKFPEAHFELGKIYFDEANYPQAIGAYEKAVSLRPTFAEAYYRLSRPTPWLGNQKKAQEAAEEPVKQRKALEASVLQREKEILRFVYTLK
jgi:tetratricopeptide (TPR) repeat protein